MASTVASEGAEDVNDFLRRIQKMREDEIKEDTERSRRLEEDILERRRQREARTAERARSLSPDKSSPISTPRAPRSPRPFTKPDLTPSPSSSPHPMSQPVKELPAEPTRMESGVQAPESPARAGNRIPERSTSPMKPLPSSGLAKSRAGTLSWQQRPASLRGPRTRPLSLVDRSPPSSSETQLSNHEQTPDSAPVSRDEISQNLAAKDPAWFRQTADRGIGSAAYRKTSVETTSSSNVGARGHALTGLSRDATPEASADHGKISSGSSKVLDQSFVNDSPADGRQDGLVFGARNIKGRSAVPSDLSHGSVPSAAPQRVVPQETEPVDDSSAHRPTRTRFERPVSPTKGMGGFVQSAMLKRSESINKRWSAQPTATLSRQDSNANSRGDLGPLSSQSMPKLGESSREGSHEASSRPGSSEEEQAPEVPKSPPKSEEQLPARSQPEVHVRERSPTKTDILQSPPSPSKRWSPLKSSWLESALSKPESPTPSTMGSLNQPSWMVELNKAKAQRASRDENKMGDLKATNTTTPIKPKPFNSKPPNQEEVLARDVPPDPKTSAVNPLIQNETRSSDLTSMSMPKTSTQQIESPPKPSPRSNPTPLAGSFVKDESPMSEMYAPGNRIAGSPKSSTIKIKPETPPKKDLRSTLKAGPNPNDRAGTEQPEFLNAFGKLKRTQTLNYVAPDELKDNILRGKSALSLTGGPIKTARKDELKEDLMKQKEVMKTKAATAPPTLRKTSGAVIPEAIAKKKALGRTNSSGNILNPVMSQSIAQPPERSTDLRPTTENVGDRKTKPTLNLKEQQASIDAEDNIEPKRTAATLATKPSSSRLADRFNPSLAAIFAKGSAQTRSDVSSTTPSEGNLVMRAMETTEDASTGQLQHMTKARARGPKRRLPKASTDAPVLGPETENIRITKPRSVSKPTVPAKGRNVTPIQNLSRDAVLSTQSPSKPRTPPKSTSRDPKPSVIDEISSTSRESSRTSQSPAFPSKPSKLSGLRSSSSEVAGATEAEQSKSDVDTSAPETTREVSNGDDLPPPLSVKNASALWGTGVEETRPKAREQVQSPTRVRQRPPSASVTATVEKSRATQSTLTSNRAQLPQNDPKPAQRSPALSVFSQNFSPTPSEIRTTPKPKAKPDIASKTVELSPDSRASEARKVFSEIFDEFPIAPKSVEIDTETILRANRVKASKIQTLRSTTKEISSDGKTLPVPSNQERVLYDHRMYVCTHMFEDEMGARQTVVYLWVGSKISESESADVQLFAKRYAKDNSGKFVNMRQGKESPSFFEALGGILITRSSQSPPYMLCGRRHLGQLAFDEVPYKATSLCSGFPFIVVAGQDKVFLWKGLGCSTEELSTASLTSMEISPLMHPVDEGKEPAEFLSALPRDSRTIPASASHWKQKPNHENYCARLFHVEWHERPVSRHNTGPATALWGLVRRQSQPPPTHLTVNEITPFAQDDLLAENIYVLDAFFEIYILVNPLTQRKAASFANALVFAQEYSVLSVSIDSRPFVPPCTVVLDGAPKDMQACFRRWNTDGMDTSKLMAGRARGKALRVMGSGEALAACRT